MIFSETIYWLLSPSGRPSNHPSNRDGRLSKFQDPFPIPYDGEDAGFEDAMQKSKSYYSQINQNFDFPLFYRASEVEDITNLGLCPPIILHKNPEGTFCFVVLKDFFDSMSQAEKDSFFSRYIEMYRILVVRQAVTDMESLIKALDQQAVRIGGLEGAISSLKKELDSKASVPPNLSPAKESEPSIDERESFMRAFFRINESLSNPHASRSR